VSHQEQLYQWTETSLEHLPHLSKTQARVLMLWSFGMVLARSCATSQIAALWSEVLDQPYNTTRQRLREFYLDAPQKRGEKRKELDVTLCFAGLLRWVLSLWHGNDLALALDATTLEDRFAVLVVSVLFGKCAIPVAWRVLPAQEKGEWKSQWLALLAHLAPAVPAKMRVLVLADRGLYARWLFEKIVSLGWHPFLRVNGGGTFAPCGETTHRKMASLCPLGGQWAGRGTAFQQSRALPCTLFACWKAGCADPWLIVTDLEPAQADPAWYRFRAWIEQGFKCLKSGGWQWQNTQMKSGARVERVWLALAIATLLTLSVGEEEEKADACPVRAFRRGHFRILARLLNGLRVILGDFISQTWEASPQEKRGNTHRHNKHTPLARENLPQ
jgi:hypothetical protein